MDKLIIIGYRVVDVIPENIRYCIHKARPVASADFNNKWPEPPPSYLHAKKSKNTLNKAEEEAAEQANKNFLKEKKSLGSKIDGIA